MIKHLLTLLAIVPALAAFAGEARAQASASPYTYGTRYDAEGRVTGTIAPNSPTHGYTNFLATRTTYDPAGRPTKVETGYLTAWQSEAVGAGELERVHLHPVHPDHLRWHGPQADRSRRRVGR